MSTYYSLLLPGGSVTNNWSAVGMGAEAPSITDPEAKLLKTGVSVKSDVIVILHFI